MRVFIPVSVTARTGNWTDDNAMIVEVIFATDRSWDVTDYTVRDGNGDFYTKADIEEHGWEIGFLIKWGPEIAHPSFE